MSDAELIGQQVQFWAGPRSLPLWTPPADVGFMRRSGARLQAVGGVLRPVHETLVDVLADEAKRGLDRPRRSGLSRAAELEILKALEVS